MSACAGPLAKARTDPAITKDANSFGAFFIINLLIKTPYD
jgi:hypothetical protein